MRRSLPFEGVGVLAMCLLSLPLLRLVSVWPLAALPSRSLGPAVPQRHRTPCEQALRAGWAYRNRAQFVVNDECEALEAWDPEAVARIEPEALRRQLSLGDPGGYLRQAQVQARRAATLARTADEVRRVAELRVVLERCMGRREAGLDRANERRPGREGQTGSLMIVAGPVVHHLGPRSSRIKYVAEWVNTCGAARLP